MKSMIDQQIEQALAENESYLSTLQMLKEIIEKKELDLLHMSDKEKIEAKIMKSRGL